MLHHAPAYRTQAPRNSRPRRYDLRARDEEDLRARAAKYGLEDEIDSLLRYLETHGEVDDDRLPEWRSSSESQRH